MSQKPFDGLKVKQVKFCDLHVYARFFTENGVGYTKHGYNECVDDFSLRPIVIHPSDVVFVEDR